ncbi:ATP-binding protein [Streptomyces sp. NPDC096153]|uniref:ATP-binding protein n=1 Tax=Streptomyces sp. NPDC096153 TaxID=3155548 RepID=UPI0033216CE4
MTCTTISRNRQQRPPLRAVPAGERVFDLRLEHGLLAPAAARHQARPVLAAWGLDEEQLYDALLVISELVTNAVTHALPPVVLHLHAAADDSRQVQVHVSDGGPQPTPGTWAATRPADEHGRGTGIVSALTDHAGTDSDTEGLIDHWADLTAA